MQSRQYEYSTNSGQANARNKPRPRTQELAKPPGDCDIARAISCGWASGDGKQYCQYWACKCMPSHM